VNDSRISGLHRLDVAQRIDKLEELGWLDSEDAAALHSGRHVLLRGAADKMIENVIGVFGLPLAIAPNFRVNGVDRLVPMAVEEPSIVAGLSFAAALARRNGGFQARCGESLLTGQIHVTGVDDVEAARQRLAGAKDDLIAAANRVHPRLVARGGGVREVEVRRLDLPDGSPLLAVHVLVDTCDAMGANLVNSICEALAPEVADICGGKIAMRILSNLADRSLVSASVSLDPAALAIPEFEGTDVRDAIVRASDIAAADSYRAATHNKGVMNGIDALAIATGNDWRAIEAGVHAYAATGGRYGPVSSWSVGRGGELAGKIRLPLKPGIVGGTVAANAAAALGIRITGVRCAPELAELMAAVGLAQNFAALRALATTGIQSGHMHLHARSVVAAAGVPDDRFDEVVARLVASGEIKAARVPEILNSLEPEHPGPAQGCAAGKVILLGEHAVVYGKHALALPIPEAVTASVDELSTGLTLAVPDWGLSQRVRDEGTGIDAAIRLIMEELGLDQDGFAIRLRSRLPRAMGLGSSAAFAVAIVRAFDAVLALGLDDVRVNEIAYACEQLAHGTPSGVDNTLATYSRPMLFRSSNRLDMQYLQLDEPPPLIIASGAERGNTLEQVAGVRTRRDRDPEAFDSIFAQMDELTIAAAEALQARDYEQLGRQMNLCQGLLNAIGVSTAALEQMIETARSAGAVGAKLTGAGGGGSIVALCPGAETAVAGALGNAGYSVMNLSEGSAAG
jgi:hydroxymethylglutaryl-CoA reductase